MHNPITADQSLYALLHLQERARAAQNLAELGFLLVNDSHALTPYRQAAWWLSGHGVQTLSGVVQKDANAPYVQWLEQVFQVLSQQADAQQVHTVRASDLPEHLSSHWAEWWPEFALWVPVDAPAGLSQAGAAALMVRDIPWTAQDHWLWQQWAPSWAHASQPHRQQAPKGWQHWSAKWRQLWQTRTDRPWWKQTRVKTMGLIAAVLLCPVPLTVMAPGELVAAHPAVIRAPLDGVIDVFHVQPNQVVKKDTPLFSFDHALIKSRLEVAQQGLQTAETEYRQTSQQALVDARVKGQLAILTGKIEEKRAEVTFLQDQLTRAQVLAPRDGVVLIDDPVEWIGRPVNVGERVLRMAATDDVEIEAWLPMADALQLPQQAQVKLYLHASPLAPVTARIRYVSHEASLRPDGQYAYRVRATLEGTTAHRVGLKGSAKLSAGWTPMAYWVFRRPLAAIRATLGV